MLQSKITTKNIFIMNNKTLENAWIDFLINHENEYTTELANQVKIILPKTNMDLFDDIISYCQLFINLLHEEHENNNEKNRINYPSFSNNIDNKIVYNDDNHHFVTNDFIQTIMPYLNDYQNKEFLALLYFHLPNDIIGNIVVYDEIDTPIREDIYQFMDDMKKQFDK